jgi:anti-anti-sigma factor
MNIVQSRNAAMVAIEVDEPGEMTELVRGREEALLERLKPLVRTQPVTLDMRNVQRIDAAGIAALISLYCVASQAGHSFTLANATPRVEEILLLVGLDRILVHEDANAVRLPGCVLQLTAA